MGLPANYAAPPEMVDPGIEPAYERQPQYVAPGAYPVAAQAPVAMSAPAPGQDKGFFQRAMPRMFPGTGGVLGGGGGGGGIMSLFGGGSNPQTQSVGSWNKGSTPSYDGNGNGYQYSTGHGDNGNQSGTWTTWDNGQTTFSPDNGSPTKTYY